MPIRWQLFRAVCIIQMLASSVMGIMTMIRLFERPGLYLGVTFVLFVLIFLLSILAIGLLNNNYPDTPVAGMQKRNFNRLYLLNFFFLVFLFGIIFAEYRGLSLIADFTHQPFFSLPFRFFVDLIAASTILLLQFIILYGLYLLRRELYYNFSKKQFDFERDQP